MDATQPPLNVNPAGAGSANAATQQRRRVGFLLIGHGTRRAAGVKQLELVFQQFAAHMAPALCDYCFLELAAPDIPTAVERMAAAGVEHLVTVPLLLFTAGHAQRDIPEAVEAAVSQFGIGSVTQTQSLECHRAILELSALRFQQAVCCSRTLERMSEPQSTGEMPSQAVPLRSPGSATDSLGLCPRGSCPGQFCSQAGLVMIGRGSDSATATEQMRRFATLRREFTRVQWLETGFIYGQQPSVHEALDALEATGLPLAVVQPHLLFEGLLIDELREEVQRRQAKSTSQKWIITSTLGTDEALASSLATLARLLS